MSDKTQNQLDELKSAHIIRERGTEFEELKKSILENNTQAENIALDVLAQKQHTPFEIAEKGEFINLREEMEREELVNKLFGEGIKEKIVVDGKEIELVYKARTPYSANSEYIEILVLSTSAYDVNAPIGFIEAKLQEDSLHIENKKVVEEFRRKSIAKKLTSLLAEIAIYRGCKFVEGNIDLTNKASMYSRTTAPRLIGRGYYMHTYDLKNQILTTHLNQLVYEPSDPIGISTKWIREFQRILVPYLVRLLEYSI